MSLFYRIISGCMLVSWLYIFHAANANEANDLANPFLSPLQSKHAIWNFSGLVKNEAGEYYGYFFQVRREDTQFHARASVLNAQTQTPLIHEESSMTIEQPAQDHWQMGRLFLSFNPINDSLVFGIKVKDNQGFNFKVDLLSHENQTQKMQELRPGVNVFITQTDRLNGHIQLNEAPEEFVTAKHTWVNQVVYSPSESNHHELKSIFCRFDDGRGFYSVTLPEKDASQGAIAGYYNAQGRSERMSQFIQSYQNEHKWHIRITSPAIHLILNHPFQQSDVLLGFTQTETGFCAQNTEKVG